jgi:hypothetical protein
LDALVTDAQETRFFSPGVAEKALDQWPGNGGSLKVALGLGLSLSGEIGMMTACILFHEVGRGHSPHA